MEEDWFDNEPESSDIPGQEKLEIEKLLESARRDAKIKLKQAVRRNIIFVGKSRVGKTTAMNVLKDPTNLVKDMSIFADTMEPALYNFTVEVKLQQENVRKALTKVLKEDRKREARENREFRKRDKMLNKKKQTIEFPEGVHPNLADDEKKIEKKQVEQKKEQEKKEEEDDIEILDELNFNINIIDTPGLFERRKIGEDVRGNQLLKKTILKCLDNEIASIHCIFFVLSVADGINEQDLVAFEEFLQLFSGAESVIAMLFTRTENYKTEQTEKIINELKKYDRFAPLIEKVGNRIFFTGSAKFEDFENELVSAMKKTISSVSKARNSLLKFILLNSKPCPVRKFKLLEMAAKEVKEKIAKLKILFEKYEKANNIRKNDYEHEIDGYLRYLTKNVHIIPPDAYDLLNEVQEKAEKYQKMKVSRSLN